MSGNGTFSEDAVHKIFNDASFTRKDTRISGDALKCCAEYLRVFTREAIWRSDQERQERQAGMRDKASTTSNIVEASDLEKIKDDLKLDF
ncbi:hypothetical protein TRICI_006566 [Trichomonascus ciferrii]|uniref:Uncharacterized protein n=1 Tax=Trichomonascus ciferrii TaxID=44093 RepID=A0A642UGH7_9ASCO|nr:hypothetical protein TRICI_006566 [Trichomonascus ciferrii]